MHLRMLACLPAAVLVTAGIMLATSLFVEAVEASLPSAASTPDSGVLLVSRYETRCDGLYRALHALSHRATRCDGDPRCAVSPLLCAGALDEEIEAEYRRLQAELSGSCGVSGDLLDYAWRTPEPAGSDCGGAHDWLEAATIGEMRPPSYSF